MLEEGAVRISGHMATARRRSCVVRPTEKRRVIVDLMEEIEVETIGGCEERREKKSIPMESR